MTTLWITLKGEELERTVSTLRGLDLLGRDEVDDTGAIGRAYQDLCSALMDMPSSMLRALVAGNLTRGDVRAWLRTGQLPEGLERA